MMPMNGEEDDSSDEFAGSSFATEGVAEDAPAELRECEELSAALCGGPGSGVDRGDYGVVAEFESAQP